MASPRRADGREVGDHRAGADEERGFPQAAEHAGDDQEAEVRRERVQRGRRRDHERTGDDEHPPPVPVTEPPGVGPEQDRAHGERADGDADRQRVAVELALHELRQDRKHRPEREEVQRAGRSDGEELGRQQALARSRPSGDGRAQLAAAAANSSAASNDARSATMPPVLHDAARLREPEHARDAATALEDRHEAARLERAVHDLHAILAAEATRALDLHVVLIGPHERHRRERLRRLVARRRSSRSPAYTPCSAAFVQCSIRMTSPSNSRVRPPRDVTRRDHTRRGEERLVADDAVVERQARAVEPARLGNDTDRDEHDVALHDVTVAQQHALDRAAPLDGFDRHAAAQIDTVIAVQAAEHLTQHRADARAPSAAGAPRAP